MKKTIIGIAILATMLVALIGTTVNAASVTATPSNITVGKEETVTVTVKTDAQISGAVLKLNYDADKFEYVEANAGAVPVKATDKTDYVKVVVIDPLGGDATTNTITLTFKAKKDLTEGQKATFSISEVELDPEEAITTDSVEVTVVKAQEPTTPEEPEKPGTDKPTTPEKPSNPTDTNGDEITDLPQTGVPMFIGAIALIIVSGAVLVIKKVK